MDIEQVKTGLRGIIANLIDFSDFGDDENFVSDLGMDSMMALEIVAEIEKKFGIKINEERLPEIQSLSVAARLTMEAMEDS